MPSAGGPPSSGHFPLDRTRPDAAAVRAAAGLLAAARSPLVVAGGGIHISDASQALSELQQAACLPVATTTMGKGAVSELHPLSVGVIGSFMGPTSPGHHLRDLVRSADVVLLAGTRTNENGTDAWRLLPDDATYISIDIDGSEVNRNYDAVRLTGDARLALEDLRRELDGIDLTRRRAQAGALAAAIASGRARYAADARPLLTSARSPLRPERIMAELDRLLPDNAITVADASYSTIWMACAPAGPPRGPAVHLAAGTGRARLGTAAGAGRQGRPPGRAGRLHRRRRRVRPRLGRAGDGGPRAARGHGHRPEQLDSRLPEARGAVQLRRAHVGHRLPAGRPRGDRPRRRRGRDPDRRARPTSGLALEKALAPDSVTLLDVMTDPDAYPPITAWADSEDVLLRNTAGRRVS